MVDVFVPTTHFPNDGYISPFSLCVLVSPVTSAFDENGLQRRVKDFMGVLLKQKG